MRSRHTTPPKVLPLLPLGVIAMFIGSYVVGIASALLLLVGIEDIPKGDDVGRADIAVGLVFDLLIVVALAVAFRWLVERWVGMYVPLSGPRYDAS